MTQLVCSNPPPLPRENIYGHVARLRWLEHHMDRTDRAVEFGCGTGYMVTYPLLAAGYNVVGIDIDSRSVEYGRVLLERAGLDREALLAANLSALPGPFEVVIASEVLEHLDDELLSDSLDLIRSKLRPRGRLLVTVPNGWGWFELEAFIWNRLGLGAYLQRRAKRGATHGVLAQAKRRRTSDYVADACPSTLAQSPHVQRFTFRSIRRLLASHGFEVTEARGSVLACGPMSDLALTGLERVMEYNCRLGRRLSPIAAGFYVAAVPRRH